MEPAIDIDEHDLVPLPLRLPKGGFSLDPDGLVQDEMGDNIGFFHEPKPGPRKNHPSGG